MNALLLTQTDDILTISLNRPNIHNAFDDQFILEFIEILQQIKQNSTVKIVVIKANGKNFSAGADLNWMKKMANDTKAANYKDALQLAKLMQLLYELNKPTIAAIHGKTFGGGLGLIASCDIAIACEDARFCFSEVRLGLIPSIISPYVIRAIGTRAAQRYFLTAEIFDAIEAQRIGLIHQLVKTDELELQTQKIAKILSRNGPQALIAAKNLIHHVSNNPIDDNLLKLTAQQIASIRLSTEGQEGIQAFLEKRKPNWMKD